jgi:glucokinase
LSDDKLKPHPETAPLLALEQERWLSSQAYPSFSEALKTLFLPGEDGAPPLLDAHAPPDVVVIAPAGPVQDNICRMPNLPWVISVQDIRDALAVSSTHMINDFAAQAYACLLPQAVDAVGVLSGSPRKGAPVAVMGAGTGFGQALLLDAPLPDDELRHYPSFGMHGDLSPTARLERFRRVRVLPSEGGHAEVAFVGPEEFDFARFVADRIRTPKLVGDTIVSGSGLAHLLAFHTGLDLSPREAAAKAPEYPQVMAWFARLYARLCRNYVLHTLALGGLYITGGMALRIPVLSHPAFAEEFHNCAAQRHLLEQVPVWHVRNPQAGLWGAALYGLLK